MSMATLTVCVRTAAADAVVIPFKGESHDVVPFPPPTLTPKPEGMPPVHPASVLHAEQTVELFRPLDPNGATVNFQTKLISLYDKGKGALAESEILISDEKGPIARLIDGMFLRGMTGFEGKGRKLPPRVQIPKRAPDAVEEFTTTATQAQVYRLSGDYNALHVDPKFAQSVGFKRPILQGLCTMGIAARALYKHFCQGDPSRFKCIRVRFANVVYPGETLETRMWQHGNTVYFQTIVKERNAVAIDGGQFEFEGTATGSRL